ncbi:hypothetical protein RLQ99_004397 [Salmonella enterica subsp. enterica serovar Muenchen]|nr:hypothetical protein [Salmonella enterica subsp. enterica serovar Muenchen]ELE3266291.1 hypothetical protein [Salmonella enterica subsp. enterica serovar Muenchen]
MPAPFFFLTYVMANQFTAGRESIGSLVFSWEQRGPFISLTTIPYWNLDLLYANGITIDHDLASILHTFIVCRMLAERPDPLWVADITCFKLNHLNVVAHFSFQWALLNK